MPIDPTNPLLQRVFQTTPAQQQTTPMGFGRGSLVMFRYTYWHNDPSPLVIITDYSPGQRIRGLNLHYLTHYYIRTLITQAAATPNFSYQNVRNDKYITSAFRIYKWNGISNIRKFDSQFILKMMNVANTFDPTQIREIRKYIDNQIQQELIPQAQPSPEQFIS